MIRLPDVLLEAGPIGLAEQFSPLDGELLIEALSDDPAKAGDSVYFGVMLPIGEIAEVNAVIKASSAFEGAKHLHLAHLVSVDAKLKEPFCACMARGLIAADSDSGVIWGRGLKQSNGSSALIVNTAGGFLTARQLEGIASAARKGVGAVKITHAQRIMIFASHGDGPDIEEGLGGLGLKVGLLHNGVRNVRACCGSLCKWSSGLDALRLTAEVEKAALNREAGADVKIAVSCCMRNCAESYCADIGLIGDGRDGAYRLLAGGRGSNVPFRAIQITQGLKPEQAPAAIGKVIDWFIANAKPKERVWRALERIGEPAAAKLEPAISLPCADGDGVDELARVKSHFARLEGAKELRRFLDL